jgi:sec-independent protein translocase protein TatA
MIPVLFPGGLPGGPELIVILLIAVLLFGANKIPKLARSTGQAMGEFQKGRQQVEQELEELQEGQSLNDDGDIVDEDGNVVESNAVDTSETSTESTSSSTSE